MTGRPSLMKKTALFPCFLILAFLMLSGCTNIDTSDKSNDTSWYNCMDIRGIVLGRLHPGSLALRPAGLLDSLEGAFVRKLNASGYP